MATEFSRKEFLDAYFGYLATEDDSLFSFSAQTTDLCGRKSVLSLRKFIQDLEIPRLAARSLSLKMREWTSSSPRPRSDKAGR